MGGQMIFHYRLITISLGRCNNITADTARLALRLHKLIA